MFRILLPVSAVRIPLPSSLSPSSRRVAVLPMPPARWATNPLVTASGRVSRRVKADKYPMPPRTDSPPIWVVALHVSRTSPVAALVARAHRTAPVGTVNRVQAAGKATSGIASRGGSRRERRVTSETRREEGQPRRASTRRPKALGCFSGLSLQVRRRGRRAKTRCRRKRGAKRTTTGT